MELARRSACFYQKTHRNCEGWAKTAEGRAKSSLNALKTGLTGHTVLLTTDDAELYEAKLLHHLEASNPVGEKEAALVQALADTEWRLARIAFAHKLDDQPADLRPGLIQSYTFLAYQKQLNN